MKNALQLFFKINVRFTINLFFFFPLTGLFAQHFSTGQPVSAKYINGNEQDVFGITSCYIENIGQYGKVYEKHPELGRIIYGYEGLDMPVLFTSKGLIHLQRKLTLPSEEEHEKAELKSKKKKKEDEYEALKVNDKAITMQWENANPNPEIIPGEQNKGYHSYGLLQKKANAFTSITYKELYPGIDLIYSFVKKSETGFEYSLVIKPGADISLIKMHFAGDVKKIKSGENGNLIIKSGINSMIESLPTAYYSDHEVSTMDSVKRIQVAYAISGNVVSFIFPNGFDASKTITIDPFITNALNLTGTNTGKAKDVDFDYAGNVFVTGGGDGSVYKLAKYDATGVLQWTFSGSLTVPAWTFGGYYGGWVVEKNTGDVYLGQGFAPSGGHRIIRLNTAGFYDNYITTGNQSFMENWKMLWSCNNGSPQLIVAGGGTNSNINLGICSPPNVTISAANVTGILYTGVTGWAQDIADIIIDPVTNEMYTIYGSLFGTPSLSNLIYKNTAPYSGASAAWNTPSGFTSVSEAFNRPYLALNGTLGDNSCNVFAVNSSYLFYWDGKNLKAYNKATGAGVGTPLTIATNTVLMQGGIEADECNNIFIGSTNGTIKVYNFNGSIFNDAPADITITGFSAKSVYDLVINDGQKLLYACGDGFVASFDISTYGCGSAVYAASVNTDCVAHTATVTLNPAPPLSATITYLLYNGLTQVASNTTGIFTALTPNINYTLHAIVNQACSGTESISNFTITGPALSISQTNTTCGAAAGSITATGSGGVAPLTYSIDGVNYQSSGNFTGLSAGVYVVTVKDITGCASLDSANIINTNGPVVSLVKADAFCGTANGTITTTGTNGTPPYQYSLNGGAFQISNIFTGLLSGSYIVTIIDATGCTNNNTITLNSIGNTSVTATSVSASCGNSNGSISANVTGGNPPYLYSINGTTFQNNNVFTGLAPASYTLTAKDASNCINFVTVTINNVAGPQISATAAPTSCNSFTGVVTVTATGVFPMLYSVNGGNSFQASNLFTALSGGTYTVMVKDANGCLNTTNIIVNLSIPQVTDSTTASSCSVNTGSITAIGTGGITPYLYSINGTTFQSSSVFSGLGSGTYTLTIKDAAGCVNSISPVIVNNADGLIISASATTTSCVTSTGTITAYANGGLAPLQYSINGVTFQGSNLFSGLSSGNYTVTVRDANNCSATVSISVNKISGPSVTATSTSTSCNNNIGTITATASSGNSPYLYSINGTTFQSANIFIALSPGPYTVTVKDANLCTGTTTVVIINVGGGSGPTVTATTQSAECGQSNGRINGNGSGGQNPKQYSIDGINWQGSTNFQNLPPGTYTLYVRDANGCINFVIVTIANIAGPQVSATSLPANCGSNTGSITATGFGGVAPYRYSIDGGVNFQTSNIFPGLPGGFYTLTVRDAANVCRNSIVVYIGNSNGPSVSFTKTDASCSVNNGSITASGAGGTAPLSYSLDGINFQSSNLFIGLGAGPFALTVKDATGCSNSTTVNINNIALPQVAVSPVSATCNNNNASITVNSTSGLLPYQYSLDGITFQSSNVFTGLASGPYLVTLKDANNCIATTNVTLSNIPGPSLSTNTIAATCGNNNGSLIITGSSGTLPYQYSINGTIFQTSFVFTGLSPGLNNVTIRDGNNCTAISPFNINSIAGPVVTAIDSASGCGGNIIVTGTGGTQPFQYNINNSLNQASNIFPCQVPGSYAVRIIDANGCIDSVSLLLVATLPVELLSFTGQAETDYNILEWSTASEINNDYFLLEKSKDGLHFETLERMRGAGNSNTILNYSVKDEHPFPLTNYYRLKQTDFNGNYKYSNVIALSSEHTSKFNFVQYASMNELAVSCNECNAEQSSLNLFDAAGRNIYTASVHGNYFKINTEPFAKGYYSLQVYSEKSVFNFKVIVY